MENVQSRTQTVKGGARKNKDTTFILSAGTVASRAVSPALNLTLTNNIEQECKAHMLISGGRC